MARQATQAFRESRGARFAKSREEAAQRRAEQVANGERAEMTMVDVEDVRSGEEVATEGGFVMDAPREDWVVVNGQTCVMRFRDTTGGA